LTEEEKKKLIEPPRTKNIEELVEQKKKEKIGYTKVELGRYIGENLSADDIDDEIKRIIERIRTKIGK
jgi:hypothetical protein